MTLTKSAKLAAELLFDKKYQLFLNFNAHTNQAENTILYLTTQLALFSKQLVLKTPFNYLDVGCGFGNKTLAMINAIQTHHPVKTIALDPSAQLLSIFNESRPNNGIDLVCSTWENYQPNTSFDFISSIHTFYYIDDWQTAILKMRSALTQNGKICIVLRTNDSVCQFRNYFFKKIHGDNTKERDAEELCDLLDKIHLSYHLDYIDSTLDITDCFMQNAPGKELIEFILRQPYPALRDIHQQIITYLVRHQENGYLKQRDACIWIANQ